MKDKRCSRPPKRQLKSLSPDQAKKKNVINSEDEDESSDNRSGDSSSDTSDESTDESDKVITISTCTFKSIL